MSRDRDVITQNHWLVKDVLKGLNVRFSFARPDLLEAETASGHRFKLHLSPFGARYFIEKQGHSRLQSSKHIVLFVFPETDVEKVRQLVGDYVEGLRIGQESEEIAARALDRVKRIRPGLIADCYKTSDQADIEGSDFRVGLCMPYTSRIFWIGLQIKSSNTAAAATVKKFGERRKNGHSGAEPAGRYLRRVISVPREGTLQERVAQTADKIIADFDRIRI